MGHAKHTIEAAPSSYPFESMTGFAAIQQDFEVATIRQWAQPMPSTITSADPVELAAWRISAEECDEALQILTASTIRSIQVGCELQSINNRFLDIQWRSDDSVRFFESVMRQMLKTRFERGRINVRLDINIKGHSQTANHQTKEETGDEASSTTCAPSATALALIQDQPRWQQKLAQWMPFIKTMQHSIHNTMPKAASLSVFEIMGLLGLPQWMRQIEVDETSPSINWDYLPLKKLLFIMAHKVALEAIDQLSIARQFEARHIIPLFADKERELIEAIGCIETLSAQESQLLSTKLKAQLAALLEADDKGLVNIPTERTPKKEDMRDGFENRLAQEVAMLARRHDIAEERDRLASHLKKLHQLITPPQDNGHASESHSKAPTKALSIGKQLDFLTQELGREINTIASKSTLTEVINQTLAMKLMVERIREQTQNIQ